MAVGETPADSSRCSEKAGMDSSCRFAEKHVNLRRLRDESRSQPLIAQLETGRKRIYTQLLEGNSCNGYACARAQADLMDGIVRTLYQEVSVESALALVAVGGYGRREMAPFSDVDLLFLTQRQPTEVDAQVVQTLLYALWDMRLKIGHAVRPLQECLHRARTDHRIGTAIQEGRFLIGNEVLYRRLKEGFGAFTKKRSTRAFVREKIAERAERHAREVHFALQPDLKNGKGGLRDLQTLLWIAQRVFAVSTAAELVRKEVFTPAEVCAFESARELFLRMRFHLHTLSGRAEERLSFDDQPEMSRRMGLQDDAGLLGVEKMMQHYFRTTQSVAHLTRVFNAALEKQKPVRFALVRSIEGFPLRHRRLDMCGVPTLRQTPSEMLRFFHVAQKRGVKTHPNAWRVIARTLPSVGPSLSADAQARQLFLQIIQHAKDAGTTMRRLAQSGVLSFFVPEFVNILGLAQLDGYHRYTVDEHTFRVLDSLQNLAMGRLKKEAPLASSVIRKITSRRALFLAALLHDIGKGKKRSHTHEGARITRRIVQRWDLEEGETVVWLVENHLIMSQTAFRRDLEDLQTIRDFSRQVASPERLRLLLLLTVADIQAVGPNAWNAWKAALLNDLFNAAERNLIGANTYLQNRKKHTPLQENLRNELHQRNWSDMRISSYMQNLPAAYWSRTPLKLLLLHALMISSHKKRETSFTASVCAYKESIVLNIYTKKHQHSFSNLAGAIATTGADIVSGSVTSLFRGNILIVFHLRYPHGAPVALTEQRRSRILRAAEEALSGEVQDFPATAKVGDQAMLVRSAPWIVISNFLSRACSVIEASGPDQPALLYRLSKVLTRYELQVRSAKIETYGSLVTDVFYVQTENGKKYTDDPTPLTKSLLEAFGETPRVRAAPWPDDPEPH